MNSVKFFVTLAVLVACIFAVSAEENARNKRFPYFGGLGYAAYGAYPYAAAGYGLGYGAYGAYGGYGGYGAYPYGSLYHHY